MLAHVDLNSQTLKLVKAVLDGAKESGSETELVDICTLNIEYCNACGTCFAKGKCIYEDDFDRLYTKILDSDGLVMGSPNYFHSVTAQMKTMLDRMADTIHCSFLLASTVALWRPLEVQRGQR